MEDRLTGRNTIIQRMINLIPKSWRLILNPNHRCIYKFMQYAASTTAGGSKVLDAGAGPGPYKPLFNHCHYEATDYHPDTNIDFVCSLDRIPKANKSYSHIICTETLEHVEYPQDVINEFYNLLKPHGKLFLTCPQGWAIHQAPNNYYNFTKFGIYSLLRNAGFNQLKVKITPKGGWFWMMSNQIRDSGLWSNHNPLKWILYPFTHVLIPLLLFPLDSLDRKKEWTNGYLVEAERD